MDIGLFSPLRSPVCTPEWLKDFGPGCESVGLRSVWMGEHVVLFEAYESRYPGSEDGKFSFPEKSGLLDMTSTLSFLAACTTTLRLGTGIRILPQANPVYTAKEYATLDFISGGRLDFGVGVGWSWEEFEACGVPWARRGARCDEYLEVLRTLWGDHRSAYEGEFYSLRECVMYPKPVQPCGIPILVGGHSEGALRRAAKYGAGWYGINADLTETRRLISRLHRLLEEEGRSAEGFRIIMGSTRLHLQASDVPAYAEAGVCELLLPYLRMSHKHQQAFLDSVVPFVETAARCG